MSITLPSDRKRKVMYTSLLDTSRQGEPVLRMDLHRYRAVVGGQDQGMYSNLGVACKTAEGGGIGPCAFIWEPVAGEAQLNCVVDTRSGQVYVKAGKAPPAKKEKAGGKWASMSVEEQQAAARKGIGVN